MGGRRAGRNSEGRGERNEGATVGEKQKNKTVVRKRRGGRWLSWGQAKKEKRKEDKKRKSMEAIK